MRRALGASAAVMATVATLVSGAIPASAETGWFLLKNVKSGLCVQAHTDTGRLMMAKCNKNVANQNWKHYDNFQMTFVRNRGSVSQGCMAALSQKDVRVLPCVDGDYRYKWEWGGFSGGGISYRYWRNKHFAGKDLTAWNDGTVSLSVSCPPCTEAGKMDWTRVWV
ncbi:ricin-type beta-trefoil lectin domain protein [Nonomuraea sp. NPDC050451]|uniref:ricin-type beta-trefoil lectin domain protein n=1 Tax=Nonomuraea sp. NPDC050451 TaxID=3364364 RepID=UPI0037B12AB6